MFTHFSRRGKEKGHRKEKDRRARDGEPAGKRKVGFKAEGRAESERLGWRWKAGLKAKGQLKAEGRLKVQGRAEVDVGLTAEG